MFAAVRDAAAAAEEVKKLTAEVSRLVAELDDTREQFTAVKVRYLLSGCTLPAVCTVQVEPAAQPGSVAVHETA